MSRRKRTQAAEAEQLSTSSLPAAKKRGVTLKTAVLEYNRELNTSVWMKFDVANCDCVVVLKVEVCGLHPVSSKSI